MGTCWDGASSTPRTRSGPSRRGSGPTLFGAHRAGLGPAEVLAAAGHFVAGGRVEGAAHPRGGLVAVGAAEHTDPHIPSRVASPSSTVPNATIASVQRRRRATGVRAGSTVTQPGLDPSGRRRAPTTRSSISARRRRVRPDPPAGSTAAASAVGGLGAVSTVTAARTIVG